MKYLRHAPDAFKVQTTSNYEHAKATIQTSYTYNTLWWYKCSLNYAS